MFIIDDLLLSPVKGFLWIVRELHKNAEEQIAGESEDLTAKLSTLYMMLETGQIGQDEFDAQERDILDRLDAIEAAGGDAEAVVSEGDEDEDDGGKMVDGVDDSDEDESEDADEDEGNDGDEDGDDGDDTEVQQ